MLGAILGTQVIAAMIVGFGWLVAPHRLEVCWLVWVYCLAWVFIEDWAKIHVYRNVELRGKQHEIFLKPVQEPLHPHGS